MKRGEEGLLFLTKCDKEVYRGNNNNICFVLSTIERNVHFFLKNFSFHIVQQQTWEKRRSPFANYSVLKPIIRVNSVDQFTKLVQIVIFPFPYDSNQFVRVVKVLLYQPPVCAKRRKERLEPKGIKCERERESLQPNSYDHNKQAAKRGLNIYLIINRMLSDAGYHSIIPYTLPLSILLNA